MRNKKIPALKFSPWVRWAKRISHLNGDDFPGIYLIARSVGNKPRQTPNSVPLQVIYIGETTKTIAGRLKQFDHSAGTGKRAHAGGRTYHKLYRDKCKHLYISILPVKNLPKDICPCFIRHLERKILWDYCRRHGTLPACNKK